MSKIAATIDHTLLRADATSLAIRNLCAEALHYNFASVCVNPLYVALAAEELRRSRVKVCSVIGFPLGSTNALVKAFEVRDVLAAGAQELDMVMAISAAKSGDWRTVENDIAAVVWAAGERVPVKVILETCLLTEREIEMACLIAKKAGATFVKTSTGMSSEGATVANIRLMRKTVPDMKIKAAGGIRDLHTARAMLEAGADRLGCSASVAIIEEELEERYRG